MPINQSSHLYLILHLKQNSQILQRCFIVFSWSQILAVLEQDGLNKCLAPSTYKLLQFPRIIQ